MELGQRLGAWIKRIPILLAVAVFAGLVVMAAGCIGAGATTTSTATKTPAATATATGGTNEQLAAQGQQLSQRYGCTACHTRDGSASIGPTWKGLYMRQVTLTDGQTITAGDAYLRESITNPDAKVVQGYRPGIMTPAVSQYQSQIQQDDNLAALVEFIKSLK